MNSPSTEGIMRPLIFVMWSLFLSSCISYKVFDGNNKAVTISNLTIEENTRLSGHIKISGPLTVPRGLILKLDPGTRIEFIYADSDQDGKGDSGIIVKGTILAEGEPEKPVLFFAGRPGPKSWSEILVEYSPASRFAYCEFKNAHWALHVHYSPLTVTSCRFIDNYGGIRFRSGPVTIKKSLFMGNNIALRYIAADPVIKNNIFKKNATAIFIREGTKSPVITGNNFSGGYAVKLGEAQDDDILAPDNYWGSMKVSEIEKVIYDKLDSDYLGRVLYDPVAAEPYSHENPQ